MRLYFAFLISTVFIMVGSNVSFADSKCPGDPLKASFQMWPAGQLGFGETKTGSDPCGKQLTCVGGNTHRGVPRKCEWR